MGNKNKADFSEWEDIYRNRRHRATSGGKYGTGILQRAHEERDRRWHAHVVFNRDFGEISVGFANEFWRRIQAEAQQRPVLYTNAALRKSAMEELFAELRRERGGLK